MNDAPRVYGEALWSLARDEQMEDVFLSNVRELEHAIRENPGYLRMLDTPAMTKEERKRLFEEAWSGQIHSYVVRFVCVLIDRGRASILPDAIRTYQELYLGAHGVRVARVESAAPLSDAQKEALRLRLEQLTRGRVELRYRVVPALIGGMRVEIDGRRFEGTARAKLDEMRRSLAEITL
ncbi:MAG: ATP synthase F1 subunit delta [Clostridia bacterium]|nr:ATP synthase F1 subunit delta [Clostridia bacterium]